MPQDSSEINKLLEAQNKPIDFIAFSGGGAKGAIYSGVLDALEENNTLKSMSAVAGSSAGALTAAFVASGITAEEFRTISATTNLKGLLGKGFLINKDGKPLYELLQKTIFKNVSTFVLDDKFEKICNARLIQIASDQEEFYAKEQILLNRLDVIIAKKADRIEDDITKGLENKELEELGVAEAELEEDIALMRYKINESKESAAKLQDIILNKSAALSDLKDRCAKGGKIYFKDLALMRIIDPIKFKDLIVTATRRDNAELIIFNAKDTPDVEIALACRASASIPLIFEPVEIELNINGKREKKQFVDGGYRDNVPTEYFEDITNNPTKKGRTLAMAFGSNSPDDSLHVALYSSRASILSIGRIAKFAMDVLFKFAAKIGGVFKYSESQEELMQKLRTNPMDVALLDTKSIGTLSFDEAQTQAHYLHIQGKIQTERHLENFELKQSPDQTLDLREFLLATIEATGKDLKKSWVSKVNKIEEKTIALLSFCEKDKWKSQEKGDVLEQFIVLASINRRTGKASNDSGTIDHLVVLLNQKTTPASIVKEFSHLVGKEEGKKFTKENFNKIIERQTTSLQTSQSRGK